MSLFTRTAWTSLARVPFSQLTANRGAGKAQGHLSSLAGVTTDYAHGDGGLKLRGGEALALGKLSPWPSPSNPALTTHGHGHSHLGTGSTGAILGPCMSMSMSLSMSMSMSSKPSVFQGIPGRKQSNSATSRHESPPKNTPQKPPKSSMLRSLSSFTKKYGPVATVVQFGISNVSIVCLYLAIHQGVDILAILNYVGLGDYFASTTAETTAEVTLALAINKGLFPLRTIGTIITVRLLESTLGTHAINRFNTVLESKWKAFTSSVTQAQSPRK